MKAEGLVETYIRNGELIRLIDTIYAAAVDLEQWPFVAQQIQQAIGGHSVNLALEDTQSPKFNFFYTNGATTSDIEYYETHIIQNDEFGRLFDFYPEGSAILSQDILGKEQLQNNRTYEKFYGGLGYAYFNSSLFYRERGRRGWLSVVRALEDEQFSLDEHRLMKALTPHFHRALLINIQMWDALRLSRIGLDCLEHISAAAILLSSRGRVLHCNSHAAPFLASRHSKMDDGEVRLPDPSANRQLQRGIQSALATGDPEASTIVTFFDRGLRKRAMCFPWRASGPQSDWLGESTGCLLFILSPDSSVPPTDQLRQTFNLSRAEVRVLQGLLGGAAVNTLADRLCISEATVRFHVRSLLRKSDSRSQAELISKVFSLVSATLK